MKFFGNKVIQNDIKRDKLFAMTEALVIVLMFVALMFFILLRDHWVEDSEKKQLRVESFDTGWELVNHDGTRRPIRIPASLKGIKAGETVVLETTLPSEISDKYYFSTRARSQAMKVYVDGDLRCDFNQTFEYFYWSEIISKYIYAPISSKDAGKTIRIEATAISDITRNFTAMYIGEKTDIDFEYVKPQFFEMILGFFFLLLGFMIGIMGVLFRYGAGSRMKVDYLGWSMMIVAIWEVTQCGFRDFIFTNIVGISAIPSIALSLFPMTLALYLNTLQNGRYRKLYIVYILFTIVMALVHIALALLRIRSVRDDLPTIFIILAVLFVLFVYTAMTDRKNDLLKEYKEVFVGMMLMAFFGTAQTFSYISLSEARGINLALGFACFAVCALTHSIKYLLRVEEGKRKAEMEAGIKSDFLATMSHEIRTPINAVLGMNQAILRESSEESILRYATDVDGAGKMLLSIINDILDFSKIESGKMDLVVSDYSLRGLVASCNNLIDKRAADKGLNFVVEVDEELPSRLSGDEVRIQQIVINLLSNAVKYTSKGHVGFKIFGEYVDDKTIDLKIHVSDTGMGIKAEDRAKLFEAFGRVDLARNKGVEGTGLGLAITGRLVDLMGGTIKVESTYGSGSVFMVSIPQGIASDTKVGKITLERAVSHEVRKVQKDLFTAPNARILVVDDVLVNLKVVKSLLKKTGMTIDTCSSGDDAILKTKEVKYDVILLDHMMPEKDGIQTFHEIREDETNQNRETPVVMLTANAIAGAKDEYMSEGFDDYISKPFSVEGLQSVLLKLLPPDRIGVDVLPAKTVKEPEMTKEPDEPSKTVPAKEDTEKTEDFINMKEALANCGNDRKLLEEKLKAFAAKDKRAELAESFDKHEILKYKEYVRVIRVDAMEIGAFALADAALKIESVIVEHDTKLLSLRHRKFVDDYSRFINVIMREIGG